MKNDTYMQLLLSYDNDESQPTGEIFNKNEIECLKEPGKKLEKKKTQVKNEHPIKKLSRATWIIAKLGGWKGAANQRPPGSITMKKGVEKFDLIFRYYSAISKIFKITSPNNCVCNNQNTSPL